MCLLPTGPVYPFLAINVVRVFSRSSGLLGSLPEGNDPASPDWDKFRGHVARLDGARLTNYVTDEICEAWIDFEWRGHAFQLNNQYGEWWLFVADPACPDAVLEDVLAHFEAVAAPGD